MAKAVAKAKQTSVELGGLDAAELIADAQEGNKFTREDLSVPFIRIIQSNSPELDKHDAKYIEGAGTGDFLNTALGQTMSGEDGFDFVPAVYTLNYTEWKPRESAGGGGLVKDYGADKSILEQCGKNDKKQDVLPNGNIVQTSALYFGYIIDVVTGSKTDAVVGMSSTQLKKSRVWNSVIQNLHVNIGGTTVNPRMFFSLFHLTTVPESNEHGKWMGFKVERVGSILEHEWGAEVYHQAKALATSFEAGEVELSANHEQAGQEDSGGDQQTTQGGPAGDDEDIPF